MTQPKPDQEKIKAMLAAGAAALRAGDMAAAKTHFNAVVAKAPDNVTALHMLSNLERDAKNTKAAWPLIQKCLQLAPKDYTVQFDAGLVLKTLGHMKEAERAFKTALVLNPACVPAHVHLASIYEGAAQAAAAEPHMAAALAAAPQSADVQGRYATLMEHLGRYDEAVTHLRRSIELDPQKPENNLRIAGLLAKMGRREEALEYYRRSHLADDSEYVLHTKAASLLFHLGEFDLGWVHYAHRHRRLNEGRGRPFPSPKWSGENISGKTLLLTHDQGMGEQIMYASLIPELQAAGAMVHVEIDARLMGLFDRSFPGVVCLPYQKPPHPGTSLPSIDFHCPFGDAGQALRHSFDGFPKHEGYLKPNPQKSAVLRARYAARANGRRLIGLSWASTAGHVGVQKSIPLMEWAPVLKTPGVLFVNLQYGSPADEAEGAAAAFNVEIMREESINPSGDMGDFADHVALMTEVISVSNATAHLAAALNVPTKVLVPAGASQFWHWFPTRAENPWYPSVRTYAQKTAGRWDDVVAAVAADMPVSQ